MQVYDPVTTAAIYVIGLLLVVTLCAVAADLWGAHIERQQRRRARADARAKRMIGEGH